MFTKRTAQSRWRWQWLLLLLTPPGAGLLLALFTRTDGTQLPTPQPWLLWLAGLLLVPYIIGWLMLLRMPAADGPAPLQRWICAAALLCTLAASTSFSQFDGLLQGFHAPGDASFGVSAATDFFLRPTLRAEQMRDAVGTWARFVRPRVQDTDACASRIEAARLLFPNDCNAPITVLVWALGVDTGVLVPAYGVLLGLLVLWSRQRIKEREVNIMGTIVGRADSADPAPARADQQDRAGAAAIARLVWLGHWAARAVLVAVVADWVENILALSLLTDIWIDAGSGGQAATCSIPVICSGGMLMLSIATWLKWIGLGLAVAYLLLALLILVEHSEDRETKWGLLAHIVQALQAARIQLLVVAVFGAALLLPGQTLDVIRRAADPPPQERLSGLLALLLPLALVLGIWHSTRVMFKFANPPAREAQARLPRWPIWTGGVVCGLLMVVSRSWKPLLPLLIVLGVVGLNYLTGARDTRASAEVAWGRDRLPRYLGAAVLVLLGLAMLQASAGIVVYNLLRGLDYQLFAWLALLGLVLVLMSMVVYYQLCRLDRIPMPGRQGTLWVALLGCVLAWGVIFFALVLSESARRLTAQLGSIAIFTVGLLLVNLLVSNLVAIVNLLAPHPAPIFRALRLRRTPVLTLIGIWYLLATLLPPTEPLHDVLHRDAPGVLRSGVTLETAFYRWRCRNGLIAPERRPPSLPSDSPACSPPLAGLPRPATGTADTLPTTKPIAPLILVASSGGGIRAAVWTTYVLDRALGYSPGPWDPTAAASEPPDPRRAPRSNWVFAVSGVSGGSVGLATYVAHLIEPEPLPDPMTGPDARVSSIEDGWVHQRLGDDYVAPTLSWLLFVETPWSFLQFDLDTDRAEILETAWERSWHTQESAQAGLSQDLFALYQEPQAQQHRPAPLLLLNGTSVESGCRFIASVLDTNGRDAGEPSARCLAPEDVAAPRQGVLGATVDLVDFVCDTDALPLSKAALLSARFPLISPSGHLTQCPRAPSPQEQAAAGRQDEVDYAPETYIVDGGYLENSAAATAIDLWTALAPLIEDHNRDPLAPAYIVPFFIQIDNGYADPAGPGAVPAQPQFVVPLATYGAVSSGRQAMARQAAELIFSKPLAIEALVYSDTADGSAERRGWIKTLAVSGCSRYAHFSLRAHPGTEAPLGWTLADESFRDLADQLTTNASQTQFDQVDNWFKGIVMSPTSCSATTTP